MIFTPLIVVGVLCNAIYCAVKIRQDFRGDHAAFGVVGLVGLVGATVMSVLSISALLITSSGELT